MSVESLTEAIEVQRGNLTSLSYGSISYRSVERSIRRMEAELGDLRTAEHNARLGNKVRKSGCDRCYCGCKYWENDRCIDCGSDTPCQHEDLTVPQRLNEGTYCEYCGVEMEYSGDGLTYSREDWSPMPD